MSAPVHGQCEPRFEAIREAFAHNFRAEDEIGAAVCVRVDGRIVADLWGGHMDRSRSAPWQRDTLVNSYSVGKAILAILVLHLAERGTLDLDAAVSTLWPEFAAHDKDTVTLRCLLGHRAGLPAVRERLPERAMLDWDRMTTALAGQAPYWPPGERHGYHCNTYGFLVGEVVRRAIGLPVERALHEFVTGPLDAEFYWGLPAALHSRVAPICTPEIQVSMDGPEQWALAFPPTGDADHDTMVWHCYFNPSGLSGLGSVNTPAWREAVIPSTNGHCTARSVAAIYGALLGDAGDRPALVRAGLLTESTSIYSDGDDVILGRPSRFGLGFQLSQPSRPLGPNPRSFGHYGYGGSLGFADPDAGVTFGYVMNRPGERWQTPRTQALLDALYSCLGSS